MAKHAQDVKHCDANACALGGLHRRDEYRLVADSAIHRESVWKT